jgi:hypothetical protein
LIRYLRHGEIDKSLWDQTISRSPQGLVYAFSWFLDIVSPDWDALVEDDYKIIFPLTKRKKAGFNYLFQPYFTQQLGLFSANSDLEEKTVSLFLDAIPATFRLIEIQLNTGNKLSASKEFKIFTRKTHHLNLSDSIQNIRKNYSENLTRNIKKANSADTKLSECTTGEIVKIFRESRGSSIENLKDDDYETFSRLITEAEKRNLIDRIGCRNESNQLIAGAVFMKSIHSWIFLFSATNDEGRNKGSMSRIIDRFIEKHEGQAAYLDFEGSMDENLSRFYKNFGSKEVVYLQIIRNNLPLLIRWLK